MLKQIAGGEEARGVVAVRPPSLDMEQAMAMDPGELLASLLPDARGETAYGALPQPPAHMHAHAEPDTPRTATPPMVPLTAELPGAIAAPLGARVHGAAAGAGSVLPPAATLPGTAGLSSGLSAEHAQGAMPLSLVPAPLAAGSRNGPERKEWTTAEDEIIQNGVAMFGCKWRRIAAQLPGRSDDAVRNRWNRLKEARDGPPAEGAEGEAAAPAAARRRSSGGGRKVSADAPGEKAAAEGGAAKDKAKPERMSWTKVGRSRGGHRLRVGVAGWAGWRARRGVRGCRRACLGSVGVMRSPSCPTPLSPRPRMSTSSTACTSSATSGAHTPSPAHALGSMTHPPCASTTPNLSPALGDTWRAPQPAPEVRAVAPTPARPPATAGTRLHSGCPAAPITPSATGTTGSRP